MFSIAEEVKPAYIHRLMATVYVETGYHGIHWVNTVPIFVTAEKVWVMVRDETKQTLYSWLNSLTGWMTKLNLQCNCHDVFTCNAASNEWNKKLLASLIRDLQWPVYAHNHIKHSSAFLPVLLCSLKAIYSILDSFWFVGHFVCFHLEIHNIVELK